MKTREKIPKLLLLKRTNYEWSELPRP